MTLPREFFDRPASEVAPDLLGCVLAHASPAGLVAAVIVETEAYAGPADPASHAFRGRTERTAVMFGPPGHAYVYFTYGMHFCVNLVCLPDGQASAVLLRAGRVIEGKDLATARRSGRTSEVAERDLARGPGRLCQALGINRGMNGADVCDATSLLRICGRAAPVPGGSIGHGPRVGISRAAALPWRFWLAGEPSVSPYRPYQPRRARTQPAAVAAHDGGSMQQ